MKLKSVRHLKKKSIHPQQSTIKKKVFDMYQKSMTTDISILLTTNEKHRRVRESFLILTSSYSTIAYWGICRGLSLIARDRGRYENEGEKSNHEFRRRS